MKRISVIFSFLTVFCLLLTASAGVSAADAAVFYVGDTNVTAAQEGTTYWLKDASATPATEFTETGATVGNHLFSVTYDATDGYTLTAAGLNVTTYGMYNNGSFTYMGGILCMSPLDIVVNSGGLSVAETAAGVYGIYADGALEITGTGDLAVSSAYIAVNNALVCDIDGAVSLSASGTSPTVTNAVTVTAGEDINITGGPSLAVTADTNLTSENGKVTVRAAGTSPVVGGKFTVDAYDDVTIENTGTGIVVGGASDITSRNGAITANSYGTAPAFISATEMTAKGSILIYNRNHSALSSSADLTSQEGSIIVKGGASSSSANVISGNAVMQAYGDITIENVGKGLGINGTADLTSTEGGVSVSSKSDGPTIVGEATVTAKNDITVTNEGFMAFVSSATLTSSAGKVTVAGNMTGGSVMGPAIIHAKGDISITCTGGNGYAVSGTANLISDDGKVTLGCNSPAPLVTGDVDITAKGDVLLTNQGNNGMVVYGAADITSTAGAVTVTGAVTSVPEIGSSAEITAYGDITLATTAEGGSCFGGNTNLTSQHGAIAVSGKSANPLFFATAALHAATNLVAVNQGSGPVFSGTTSVAAQNGNINVSSAGDYAALQAVTVGLGALTKTATFTAATCADPVGFTSSMLAYRVFGGADADHLTAISPAIAKDYSCVQFRLALAVTAGNVNMADFDDNGSGNYTVTAAGDLAYEQSGTATAGVYLGVYFRGLAGVNGTDYYLSYGESDSVGWDEHKKVTVKGSEADPSLYVNLVDGEKTLYVYFDADGPKTDCSGIVVSLQYQIPDDAVYNDGVNDYTWNGASWVQSVRNPFGDVSENSWYMDDIMYVYAKGLMIGTGEDTFSPADFISRGAVVMILWRQEGSPSPTSDISFDDVAAGAYYTDAVAWAAENDIIKGYPHNKFGPKDVVTREQFALILYRYAVYRGYDVSGSADLSGFTDAGQISAYALTAVKWANANGFLKGTSATRISPQNGASRAQAAALIHRFLVAFPENA